MKMSSLGRPSGGLPGNYMRDAWTKTNLAKRTDPTFCFLGGATGVGLNGKFGTVFNLGPGYPGSDSLKI